MESINRFKACRQAERRGLLETINDTKSKRSIYTSHSQFHLQDLRLLSDVNSKTQTFGTLLAQSKEERRLINHEKAMKIWDKRSEIYSKKCNRNTKS